MTTPRSSRVSRARVHLNPSHLHQTVRRFRRGQRAPGRECHQLSPRASVGVLYHLAFRLAK